MNRFARWLFVALAGVPAVLFVIGAVLLRSPHLFFGGFVMALIGCLMYAISRGVPSDAGAWPTAPAIGSAVEA